MAITDTTKMTSIHKICNDELKEFVTAGDITYVANLIIKAKTIDEGIKNATKYLNSISRPVMVYMIDAIYQNAIRIMDLKVRQAIDD